MRPLKMGMALDEFNNNDMNLHGRNYDFKSRKFDSSPYVNEKILDKTEANTVSFDQKSEILQSPLAIMRMQDRWIYDQWK